MLIEPLDLPSGDFRLRWARPDVVSQQRWTDGEDQQSSRQRGGDHQDFDSHLAHPRLLPPFDFVLRNLRPLQIGP